MGKIYANDASILRSLEVRYEQDVQTGPYLPLECDAFGAAAFVEFLGTLLRLRNTSNHMKVIWVLSLNACADYHSS